MGSAWKIVECACLSTNLRQVESNGAPVQYVLSVQVRLQHRTGKDHAGVDRHAGNPRDQNMAVRWRGKTEPESVHHPGGHRTSSRSCQEIARPVRIVD